MNYNKFTSPTDGDRDWSAPATKNNLVLERFTGPDGYGWTGNTQANYTQPYMQAQPCGCNDHKPAYTPPNNMPPALPDFSRNNTRNYQG